MFYNVWIFAPTLYVHTTYRSASAVKFWKICLHRSHKTHMYPTSIPARGRQGGTSVTSFTETLVGSISAAGGLALALHYI